MEAASALGARVTGPEHDPNTANSSASFSTPVVEPSAGALLVDLIDRLRDLGLPRGLERSLRVKLQHAQSNLQRGLTKPTCHELGAFVSEVRALSAANVLMAAPATLLTDGARRVEAAVPCE
jgi:hypothetical protein